LAGFEKVSIAVARPALRGTKFGGGSGKRGRAKIPSPQLFEPEGFSEPERPPSFLPARAIGF